MDTQLTVDELIARWAAQEGLGVSPSLVSLRLVSYSGDDEPTLAQEAGATVLQPRKTLAQAGVVDGAWLVAAFADVGA